MDCANDWTLIFSIHFTLAERTVNTKKNTKIDGDLIDKKDNLTTFFSIDFMGAKLALDAVIYIKSNISYDRISTALFNQILFYLCMRSWMSRQLNKG